MMGSRICRYGVSLVLVVMVIGARLVAAQDAPHAAPDFTLLIEADDAMQHIDVLAGEIGARVMGSEEEALAAAYIGEQFAAWGYTVEVQEFVTDSPYAEADVTSRNVIATRTGMAADAGMIVIGAHMDSVIVGRGADDNASGIAAMLAAAEALAGFSPPQTLVFIAFGAEENGTPSGAEVYVESLGDAIEQVIAMINIDTVGIGTDLNVYAGAVISGSSGDRSSKFTGGPIWVRDLALTQAVAMGLPLTTTPANSWNGYTGRWSDHYAFVLADVPIAYVEAWQWTDTANPWWGRETPEGDYLHTERDVIANVVPEKVEMAAEVVAATVYAVGYP